MFKFEVSTGKVESLNTLGDFLYTVTIENTHEGEGLVLNKMNLYPDDVDIPRLDNLCIVSYTAEFNNVANKTKISIEGNTLKGWDQGIILNDNKRGEILSLVYENYNEYDGITT